MHEWMQWEPTKAPRFASWILTPARVVVGVGAVLAVVAGFMPWAEGTAPGFGGFGPVFFSGLGGSGDGVVLVLVSAATGFLTLHHAPATSRIRSLRAAPAVLVLLAVFTWINGYRAALEEIAAWERRGGSGQIALGLWLAALGILLQAAGTLWLLPEVIRWRRHSDDPSDLMEMGPREVAEVVLGLVGVIVGGAVGIVIMASITGPMLVGAIALGAVFGGLLGAYGGSWVARAAADRIAAGRNGT
ncbi:MAG TPA: hypothetical protein VES19_17030 [Candidatus Limnocylindrales bacterium]|nr:hypothetical protein [Candidatus Limnocylindrales bacterium]